MSQHKTLFWNLLAGVAVFSVLSGMALSVLAAERTPVARAASQRPALIWTAVTDTDPADYFSNKKAAPVPNLGPFNARTVEDLFVVAIYDRRLIGNQPFDQVTRFILPDGGLFQENVTPINPAALPGTTISRPELSPVPIPVNAPARLRRVSRALPAGTLSSIQMREATFTTEFQPVKGTMITKSNLYGEWKVEVMMVRDGKVLAKRTTTFQIDLPQNAD